MVVISGSEINTRRPGKVSWRREKKSQTSICKELDRITRKPGCARIPIFIFGYSQMVRGESFRYATRVPTHVLCALGAAYSVDNIVQCVGRGSGAFKDQLQKNGFAHVTLLIRGTDFDIIGEYMRFQDSVVERSQAGETFEQILDGTKDLGGHLTSRTKRPIGYKKQGLTGAAERASHMGEHRLARVVREHRDAPLVAKLGAEQLLGSAVQDIIDLAPGEGSHVAPQCDLVGAVLCDPGSV